MISLLSLYNVALMLESVGVLQTNNYRYRSLEDALDSRPYYHSVIGLILSLTALSWMALPALAEYGEWVEAAKWREPGGAILSVAVSPDGESIVTGVEDGTVRLRNVLTGKSSALRGHTDAVNDVAYDPKGRYIVSASKDRTLRVWDIDRRRIRLEIRGTRSAATAVAIDGENDIIISGGSDNVVRFFDANTGGKLREYGVRGRMGVVTDILLDVSGTMALVSGGPFDWTSIRIHGIATATGAYLGEKYITSKNEAINAAIARSDDGRTFAAGGEASVLTVWGPGVSARRSTGHVAAIRGVTVSPSGDLIATASEDKTVRIWDAATGSEVAVLEGHSKAVNDVAFGATGDWLVSVGSDRITRLWRPDESDAPLAVAPAPAEEVVIPQVVPTPVVATPPPAPRLRLNAADISLRTSSGDGTLDADGSASLDIYVENDGDGVASGFQIILFPAAIPGLVYESQIDIRDVSPGASAVTSVPIRAATNVATATHDMAVGVRAPDGSTVDSAVWRLPTRQRPDPSLSVVDYLTTDDNGVTPGATTTASITVRNGGSGFAEGVSISLVVDSADVAALPASNQRASAPNILHVGSLAPSSSTSASFSLTLPTSYVGGLLPTRIVVREGTGNFGVDESVALPVWELPAPSLTVVEAQLHDADPDGVLVTGEPAVLRIKVANEGAALASGVRIVVSPSSLPGLMYMGSVFMGDMSAGASDVVTLPIGALEDVQRLSRTLTLVAVDTDGNRSAPIEVNFRTRPPAEPELRIAAVLVDGSDAGVIVPGFAHVIEVSLVNDGTGDAEGVTVILVASNDGQAAKVPPAETPVSTVAPGRTATFTFGYAAPDSLSTEPVAFRVSVSEQRGQYGVEDNLMVSVRRPEKRLVRTHALLVGVNQYDSHADLVNPVGDTQAIAAELTEVYGATVEALADPTRHEFLTALYALADREYGEEDQLIVMFSGHGWYDERMKRGFLAFRDSAALDTDPFYDTYVSHENLRTVLERLSCKHVLLVVDSCFSGTLDPMIAMAAARPVNDPYGLVPREEYIERKLRYRTRRYITAGGREYVSDGRPGHHSPFVRQMLEALRSYGGGDGILTLEEMLLYLERVTPEPRSGELYGNEPGSSFVFVARSEESSGGTVEPTLGAVLISVSPPDARIAIDGAAESYSGLSRGFVAVPTASKRRYRLPVGVYRLRVSSDGYVTNDRQLRVTAGSSELSVTLQRQ